MAPKAGVEAAPNSGVDVALGSEGVAAAPNAGALPKLKPGVCIAGGGSTGQSGHRDLSGGRRTWRRQCCGQRRQGVWRADRWLKIHATMLASSTASRRCRQRAQGKVQRAVEQQGAHRGSRRGTKAERHADVAAGRPAAAAGTRAGCKAGQQAFRRSAGALSDWNGTAMSTGRLQASAHWGCPCRCCALPGR